MAGRAPDSVRARADGGIRLCPHDGHGVLESLARAGVIERRRRAGSFVRRLPAHLAVSGVPDLAMEVAKEGFKYGYRLLSSAIREVDDEEELHFGLEPAAPVRYIEALHTASGRPYALEKRFILLSAVPEARDVDFSREPPAGWLLRKLDWKNGQNLISARLSDGVTSELLALAPGSPCIVVDRSISDGRRVATAVRFWYAQDRRTLFARYAP